MRSDRSAIGQQQIDLQIGFYRLLSIAAPLYYGLITLHYVFGHEFIVQDDMRQHVVWFQSFIDPAVFDGDAIAHYFRSVAPLGVTAVYWLGAKLGIAPLLLAKLLPLPLALVATRYMFAVTLAIAPSPLAAWLTTLMFNQQIWLNDDLVSATPRAFVYPLFAAFLYYLVQRSLLPTLFSLVLLGLFFPQMLLVSVAVLVVRVVSMGTKTDRTALAFAILGLLVAIAILIPFALSLSDYGSAVTLEQMRSLPEYQQGGRNQYFGVHPLHFILHGSSGIRIPVFPSIIWAGFALPFLCRWKMPTIKAITPQIRILVDLIVASFGLFILAHILLLRLHFPSRYLYHSWRFILAIATGIVVAAVVEKMRDWWRHRRKLALVISGAIAVVIVGVPLYPPLVIAFQGWIVSDTPEIYRYLATQPINTIIASFAAEANNIPAFSHRSTWIGREFSLPHHPQYYDLVSDRTAALLQAQYSPNVTDYRNFLTTTGVDFLLIEASAFTPEYLQQDWLLQSQQQSQVNAIITQLEEGVVVAIAPHIQTCTAVESRHHRLVNMACLIAKID